MTVDTSELSRLAKEILNFEDYAITNAQNAVRFKIEIGNRLIRAQKILPRGQFADWGHRNFGWSRRHLVRHMTLARNGTRVSQMASFRQALATIAAPEKAQALATVPRQVHPRFLLLLESGEAELELRAGNVDEVTRALESAAAAGLVRELKRAA